MAPDSTCELRMMFARAAANLRRAAASLVAALAAASLIVTPAAAQTGGLIRDAEIEQTLRAYTDPILVAAGLRAEDVDIYIIEDPSLNAFVTGGQNIFIHTGLILAAQNPNEIIGVIAHETGHIAGGHLMRSREAMKQAMGPAWISLGLGVLLIAAGAPDAGAAVMASSGQFAQGNFVRHTQAQESSADQAAITFLERTGQSSEGLISFFNRNLRPYEFAVRRVPPYAMTHPFTSDRVEALRPRVEAAQYRAAEDSDENWNRFRMMQAKLIGFLNTRAQTLARYPTSDVSQPARYARAVAYYRTSDLPAARAELDTLISESPNNPYYQELMGQILFENNRAAESVAFHRRSVELDPGQPLLLINLARATMAADGEQGAQEAVRLLQDAVAREPENAFAWRELASAREALGQRGLAELASAEQNYAVGNYPAALNFAERARRTLERNSVAYQRALDITNFAGEQMRDMAQNQRRGG